MLKVNAIGNSGAAGSILICGNLSMVVAVGVAIMYRANKLEMSVQRHDEKKHLEQDRARGLSGASSGPADSGGERSSDSAGGVEGEGGEGEGGGGGAGGRGELMETDEWRGAGGGRGGAGAGGFAVGNPMHHLAKSMPITRPPNKLPKESPDGEWHRVV